MRQFISIVEARPKLPVVDHVAQAQAIYDKALKVAQHIGRNILYLQKWNYQWVNDLRALAKEAQQTHAASEQETAEYEQESGRTYQPRPFTMADYIDHMTAKWWDDIQMSILGMQQEANSAYEEYQDDHPKVESSDAMSIHQGEVQMAQTISHRGSDTPQGMAIILDAIDSFAETLNFYSDFDRLSPCTSSTLDVITSIIPAIMTICQMRGAKKSA